MTTVQLGAFISDDGVTQRVNGMIGITRALGDHMMKELIINDPHLHATELTPEDKFVILACDGVRLLRTPSNVPRFANTDTQVWDVITDQEAVDMLKVQYMRVLDVASY